MTLLIVLSLVAAAVIAFAIVKKRSSTIVEKAEIVEAEIVAPVKKELTLKPKKQSAQKKQNLSKRNQQVKNQIKKKNNGTSYRNRIKEDLGN